MNSRWANSKTFLPGLLVITVAIIGVLTILVMRQRHDLSTVDGRVHSRTDLTVPTSPAPQVFPVPQVTSVPQVAPTTPALVAPASRIMPPQLVPSPRAPLKPKKPSYRRVNPVPTRPSVAAVHPVIPAPQTNPDAKPGGPDGW